MEDAHRNLFDIEVDEKQIFGKFAPMNNVSLKLLLLLLLIILPFSAKANMIWPSVYIINQYYSWYVILFGLVVEFIAIKLFLKVEWRKSALIAISMNLISALTGIFLIPISGIIVEFLTLPFGSGTFQLSHWILDYIAAVLCNVIIEGLVLKFIFKYTFKKNFWWLFGANSISVLVCAFIPIKM